MTSPLGVVTHCPSHCSTRVAPPISRHTDLPWPPPSSSFSLAVPLVCPVRAEAPGWQLGGRDLIVAALKLIPHGTNLRWPCTSSQLVEQDHQSGSHSAVWAGKISGVVQLNRKLHPLWCSPANSFKFQSCDRTSQAARLSLSLQHCSGSWPMQHLTGIVYAQDYSGI